MVGMRALVSARAWYGKKAIHSCVTVCVFSGADQTEILTYTHTQKYLHTHIHTQARDSHTNQ